MTVKAAQALGALEPEGVVFILKWKLNMMRMSWMNISAQLNDTSRTTTGFVVVTGATVEESGALWPIVKVLESFWTQKVDLSRT